MSTRSRASADREGIDGTQLERESRRVSELDAEEDGAQQLAEAWVKIATSDISAKTSTNAPGPSQEKAERILTEMAAVAGPNLARELAAL